MRIAHLSDLHVIATAGVPLRRMLNKRVSGYANLRLRRARQHQRSLARRVLEEVRRREPDHVVITGDMTYLALEPEFEGVRQLLQKTLAMAPADVSVVPGNHDVYTRGAAREGRFESFLGEYATSDLPNVAAPMGQWTYPFVRLRGPAAIVGLTTAVARPPLVASGVLGAAQREALRRILTHDELRSRVPVILQHHPPTTVHGWAQVMVEGLTDGAAELRILRGLPRGLVLHGHHHRCTRQRLAAGSSPVEVVGATSASLVHELPDRRAGYNEIELDDDDGQLLTLRRRVLDPQSGSFSSAALE